MPELDFGKETRFADQPRRHHAPAVARRVRASYDAAQSHAGNAKHWAQSDGLSANAANNASVRRILRNRARYEAANNTYAAGIIETLANDTIGTGPRLQMRTGDDDLNELVEREFAQWAVEVRLAEKLRTMKMAQVQDGEVFAPFGTNERLRHPVQLDFKPVEAERISNGIERFDLPVEGIEFDDWGNPVAYYLLRDHPGDYHKSPQFKADRIEAKDMLHLFKVRRPGQARGIPDITPALPLFAMLRRYTLAVIEAAEAAADIAGVIQTDAPASEDGYDVDPLDTFELVRGMFTSLPDGWKMGQLKAEQPTTTYGDFKVEILKEIARCLNMPYNIAAGDSSAYNYASGRLDHQTYFKAVWVDQSHIGHHTVDHIFRNWLEEAQLVEGYLPQELRGVDVVNQLPDHEWFWDGFEHVDPAKEASSDDTRLKNGTLTLPDYYAKQGKDYEKKLQRQAKALGVSVDDLRAMLAKQLYGGGDSGGSARSASEQQDREEAEANA